MRSSTDLRSLGSSTMVSSARDRRNSSINRVHSLQSMQPRLSKIAAIFSHRVLDRKAACNRAALGAGGCCGEDSPGRILTAGPWFRLRSVLYVIIRFIWRVGRSRLSELPTPGGTDEPLCNTRLLGGHSSRPLTYSSTHLRGDTTQP
jgi:hypothetical protein